MKLNRNEVARYLGYGKKPVEAHIDAMITECETAMRNLRPLYIARKTSKDDFGIYGSKAVQRHLADCPFVWVVVVTLGSEADRLLRVFSASNMAKGTVMHACMSVLLEQYFMQYLEELENPQKEEYLISPYSPGYGDFSLSWQSVFLEFVDAGRRIGVYLTEAGMLVPEKTITAIVGICEKKQRDRKRRQTICDGHCGSCSEGDCTFRKE